MRYILNHMVYKKLIAVMLLLLFSCTVRATTYYTRSSGANWNQTSSWSTVTYAGAAASSYPVGGDTVNIADGITVFVNANSACAVLNIGQGTSGIIQFASSGAYTLTVSQSITVNNGAKLWYNSNNTRSHTLSLQGNLINNGTVDLVYDGNDVVNLTFSGAINSTVSGTGAWTLNNVTMLKSSTSYYVEIQPTTFESAIATLTATTGTYIHNNSSSYSINASAGSDFTINSTTAFKVPQGTVTFSPGSNTLYLQGSLYVNGGNVYVGTSSANSGIQYDASAGNVPYLEISSGSMNVYGGINNKTSTDAINFKMSGGTLLVNNGSGNVSNVIVFNDVANSIFNMSEGTIIIQKHNNAGGGNGIDWAVCGTYGSVTSTGGTVQFGNSSTASGTTFAFEPFGNVVQPNIKITGTTAAAISLQPAKNTADDFKFLSLYIDTGKTFDVRNLQVGNGDTRTMTLTSTYDGTYALYNRGTFTARSGNVTLAGSEAQTLGGTSPINLYDFTMATSAYGVLAAPVSVSNLLTMTNGILYTTSTNILTCTSSASATIGSAVSYIDGPMIHTVATTTQQIKTYPIGKGSSYRPAVMTVNHSSGTSVTYQAEVINSSAMELGYTLPSSLARVSYTRYWNFTRENVSNFTSATMQLHYNTDDSVSTASSVRVAHDDGSGNWVNYGGTGTANVTGSITSSAIASFKSKFALGFPPSALPIELAFFKATLSGQHVECNWKTITEINNNYFTVERSTDGEHYDSLLSVAGAGNSNAPLNYSATDEQPLDGDSYYRLRQTDYDGKTTLSKPVHIHREANVSFAYTVFPNPAKSNTLYINGAGSDMKNVKVVVQDMMGKEVKAESTLSLNNKEIRITVSPAALLNTSVFMVSMQSDTATQRERVIIER